MAGHDLVIRNGTIVDGSGVGDMAVAADFIVAIGAVEGAGAREVDAAGLIVAPGFVA